MSEKRKQYSPQEKVSILRRHFVDKVPVSDLCDEYGLHRSIKKECIRPKTPTCVDEVRRIVADFVDHFIVPLGMSLQRIDLMAKTRQSSRNGNEPI